MDNEPLSAMALGAHTALTADEARRVINAMLAIIDKPNAPYRAKTAAARVLAQYQRAGLDAIRTATACDMADIEEQLEQLEARASAVAEGDR
jgi:hypothetical protein